MAVYAPPIPMARAPTPMTPVAYRASLEKSSALK
jgi:hypothetical protein